MSDHIVSVKTYFLVFAALMVLTALTVWVAFMDLGFLNTLVALGIAIVKATLVVLIFMHVRYGSHLTWVFAISGFFWLLILLVFVMSDYLSRSWQYVPQGW